MSTDCLASVRFRLHLICIRVLKFYVFHSTIESIYKEYCEQNSKEQPKYQDCNPSDDLMWTDSTVWAKVHQHNVI